MNDNLMATASPAVAGLRHEVRRVRHETRRRLLTVASVELLNAGMLRIGLHSPELKDFVSAAPDDHIKLIFPQPDGEELRRDYTPRSYDNANGILVIDFALHDAGPATNWARTAQPGDTLEIGGPRGSMLVPDTFDWYVLVGDTTALPAIGRRIEELRPNVPVATVVLVDTAHEAQSLETQARWTQEWVVGRGLDDAALVCDAIDRAFPQDGDGFVFIAGEAGWMAAVRDHVLERHRHPKQWMKAAGYWTKGFAEGES